MFLKSRVWTPAPCWKSTGPDGHFDVLTQEKECNTRETHTKQLLILEKCLYGLLNFEAGMFLVSLSLKMWTGTALEVSVSADFIGWPTEQLFCRCLLLCWLISRFLIQRWKMSLFFCFIFNIYGKATHHKSVPWIWNMGGCPHRTSSRSFQWINSLHFFFQIYPLIIRSLTGANLACFFFSLTEHQQVGGG